MVVILSFIWCMSLDHRESSFPSQASSVIVACALAAIAESDDAALYWPCPLMLSFIYPLSPKPSDSRKSLARRRRRLQEARRSQRKREELVAQGVLGLGRIHDASVKIGLMQNN